MDLKLLTPDQIRELKRQGHDPEGLKGYDGGSNLYYEKGTGQVYMKGDHKNAVAEIIPYVKVNR